MEAYVKLIQIGNKHTVMKEIFGNIICTRATLF